MSSTTAKKSIGIKGKVLHSQAREIIANVMNFMKEEAENGVKIPVANFKERLLAATKISEGTYRKKRCEAQDVQASPSTSFSTPRKHRPRKSTKSNLHEGQIQTIRTIIHDFSLIEKRQPTLRCVYNKVMASEIGFEGGLTTLHKVITTMGFKWKTTADKRKVLMESFDIRLKRINYLRQLQIYINEHRPIIFTDESYINSCHTTPKSWTDGSTAMLKKPIGKGPRLVMVHAGGKDGFVPNALLMFKSGSKSGDYHDDMNHKNFMQWIHTQLLPNLPPRSCLVIDNASYHNVPIVRDPTTASRKQEMINWLVERNIAHDASKTKPELYSILKAHKGKNIQYVLDTELAKYDHRVLRLPPYHPELNPIEKIWGLVKNWVAARNVTYKLQDVMDLAKQKFDTITVEDWAKVCAHVDKVVADYVEKEHLLDAATDGLTFMVNTGDSDDDEELSDDDDDLECCPIEWD